MPKQVEKYRVFIASPSDLFEERESITSVIAELNTTYGSKNNIVIELVKWETNTAPAISSQGVQSIINEDISEYDIFVGLLWTRFGTPTKNFLSGTEEEFYVAYEKFRNDNSSIQILFYFKTTLPVSIDDIDGEQVTKVKNFKSSLGSKNILHWDFNNKEDLGSFLRQHLPMRIDSLRNKKNVIFNEKKNSIEIKKVEDDDEELGVIDYQEIMNESLNSSILVLGEISKATDWVCVEIEKRTKEMLALVKKSKTQVVGSEMLRNVYKRTADVLNTYANKIEPEIPVYFDYFEKGIDSYSKLAIIYMADFDGMEDQILKSNEELEELLDKSSTTIIQLKSFLDSIESIQRVSKEINSAKKNLSAKLNDLVEKLEKGHEIASDVYNKINTKLRL